MIDFLIDAWVKNGSQFSEGIAIYNRFGNSDYLKKILSTGENSFTRKKLSTALIELKSTKNVEKIIPNLKSIQVDSNQKAEKPKLIIDLSIKWKQLYKEANAARSLLRSPEGLIRSEMQQIAFEILNKMEVVRECWNIIDHFESTGELLQSSRGNKVERMSIFQLTQLIKNIPTYISKINSEIKLISDNPKLLQKKMKQLAKHEGMLHDANNRIFLIDKKLKDGTI